jgi:hypothetical protein
MLRSFLLTVLLVNHSALSKIVGCGGKFKINALGVWPDPAVPNSNFTVSLDYTVPDGIKITEGTTRYSMVYNFIPLSPTTEPLCPNNVQCPIVGGTYNKSSSSIFPAGLIGTIVIKSEWFDPLKNLLLCYQINTKI